MLDLLKKCGISNSNFGGCVGGSDWSTTKDAGINTSINPSNEEVIASVFEANKGDYEKIVKEAQSAFAEWRKVPAPVRGIWSVKWAMRCERRRRRWATLYPWKWEKLRKKVLVKFRK